MVKFGLKKVSLDWNLRPSRWACLRAQGGRYQNTAPERREFIPSAVPPVSRATKEHLLPSGRETTGLRSEIKAFAVSTVCCGYHKRFGGHVESRANSRSFRPLSPASSPPREDSSVGRDKTPLRRSNWKKRRRFAPSPWIRVDAAGRDHGPRDRRPAPFAHETGERRCPSPAMRRTACVARSRARRKVDPEADRGPAGESYRRRQAGLGSSLTRQGVPNRKPNTRAACGVVQCSVFCSDNLRASKGRMEDLEGGQVGRPRRWCSSHVRGMC